MEKGLPGLRRADTRFAFSSEPTSSTPGCIYIVSIAITDFLLNTVFYILL